MCVCVCGAQVPACVSYLFFGYSMFLSVLPQRQKGAHLPVPQTTYTHTHAQLQIHSHTHTLRHICKRNNKRRPL